MRIYSQDIGMEFCIENAPCQECKAGNDTGQNELNYQIKKKSERSEKRKPSKTREF